ncbi:MAG: STAS domain-containing protein [Leptospiraceae bacterium]|nr:STAS domain-containing protein [Leptospiraceae bacterium]
MKRLEEQPVAKLSLSGALRSQRVYEVEDALNAFAGKNQHKVIVDLTQVGHISSSALGLLARFSDECRQANGELRLVVTEQNILNLLQITMLDKVFEIYGTVAEAEEDF